MASRSCTLLAQKFIKAIGRDLTGDEMLQLEELVLNRYTTTLLKFIDGLTKKPLKHSFDGLYGAASGGVIRAAERGTRKHALSGKLLETYKKCDGYKPGMNESEMQAVVEMADKFTPAEINRAIAVAESRNVSSVRYALGVCVGMKDIPTERTKTIIVPFADNIQRPTSDAMDTAWDKAMDAAIDKLRVNEAERAAKESIEDR